MAEKKAVTALWSLVGGVAIGVVLGLMFAPKSGHEAREGIGGWFSKRRAETREPEMDLGERIPT